MKGPSGLCVGPPMPGEQGERAPLSLSASSLLTLSASSVGAAGTLSNRALEHDKCHSNLPNLNWI